MAIQMRTGVQDNTYSFKTSRLEKILNASTLNDAQRMGFLDKIADRFRGGVKREAIRQLYNSIAAPQAEEQRPAGQLQRFNRLRDMAQPDARGLFTVECAPPQERGGQWGYSLSIDNTPIYKSPEGMLDTADHAFEEFNGEMKAQQLVVQGEQLAASISAQADAMIGGRTIERYATGAIDFVGNDPDARAHLRANLDNADFSSANFQSLGEGSTPDTFTATFKTPKGQTHTLELDNRAAGNGEFRGDRLKAALSSGRSYANLRELFSSGFNGPKDRHIGVLVNQMIQLQTQQNANSPESDLPKTRDELLTAWKDLESSHPESAQRLNQTLKDARIGNTTVFDVLHDHPPVEATLRKLVDALGPAPTDPIAQVRTAIGLGQAVLALPGGPDPEMKDLESIIKRELRPMIDPFTDERLGEINQAFERQPELFAVADTIFDSIKRTAVANDWDPGTPEFDAHLERTHSTLYGSRALGFIKTAIHDAMIGRGLIQPPEGGPEPILLAAQPVPERVERIIRLHVAEGLSLEQAVAQADQAEQQRILPDPRQLA